jgi:hypothetical protein
MIEVWYLYTLHEMCPDYQLRIWPNFVGLERHVPSVATVLPGPQKLCKN